MARAWFAYDGTGSTASVDNYIYIPYVCTCWHGRKISCLNGVFNGTSKPAAFSSNLLSYIGVALVTGVPQPSIPSSAKKYVYLCTFN